MSAELIQRWMDVVKPFDIDEIMATMADQYAKAMSWDDETKARAKRSLLSIDKKALDENIRMFAEENFSEASLKAAVEFFESSTGTEYLAQRKVVMEGSQYLVTKFIAQGIKKEFGI